MAQNISNKVKYKMKIRPSKSSLFTNPRKLQEVKEAEKIMQKNLNKIKLL